MKFRQYLCNIFVIIVVFISFVCIPGYCKEVDIVILHTADIHGYVSELQLPDNGGGMLKCAQVISRMRKRYQNVLLIDCGDLIQGTAESYLTNGDLMMKAVEFMRYDCIVPGNHEFDWGVTNLRRLYKKISVPVIVANITSSKNIKPVLPGATPYILKNYDGVNVVVIGLTTPHIPYWTGAYMLNDLEFQQSCEALWKIMPKIRELQADVIILAVHQGYLPWGDNKANQINKIAAYFPELDVIIGSHTHREIRRRELKGISYTQPGCHGQCLGKILITVDNKKHRITDKQFNLIPIDSSIKAHNVLKRECMEEISQAEDYLNTIVGIAKSPIPAESKFPGQSKVQTLIAQSIMEVTDADAVFHGTLSACNLDKGNITNREVWNIIPYENRIGIVTLTVRQLDQILEENTKFWNSYQFRGVAGITYDIQPESSEGSRVTNIRDGQGNRLAADKILTVALNSYDMASAGGRFPQLKNIVDSEDTFVRQTNIDTREAVMSYIRKHSPLDIKVIPGAVQN
jgi:2',3'-cyclic-nucleotide 2'-phosphodiesterase / 3'-nucleotidase